MVTRTRLMLRLYVLCLPVLLNIMCLTLPTEFPVFQSTSFERHKPNDVSCVWLYSVSYVTCGLLDSRHRVV